MKRDWDLLRKQLIDIEEERDILADFPSEPNSSDMPWDEYEKQYQEFKTLENRLGGHLELLVKSGYVEGLHILRGADGSLSFGISSPRLTMAGHDLLDTMRSSKMWELIRSNAASKGIELTFDAIKALGALALKQILGS